MLPTSTSKPASQSDENHDAATVASIIEAYYGPQARSEDARTLNFLDDQGRDLFMLDNAFASLFPAPTRIRGRSTLR
jgi:hypothetical protein